MSKEELSEKDQLLYVFLGIAIGVVYVGVFMFMMNTIDGDLPEYNLIPEADAQVQPFELQLDQIRNPEDCTRKMYQGKLAVIPFVFKVFYDTTDNRKFEIKQQANTFPVTQQSPQVMTFFTEGLDQYEVYLEINYDDAKDRQVYYEVLSNNALAFSNQEKFDTKKYCMRVLIMTQAPEKIPTREEIWGDTLEHVEQIPSFLRAFNANTITTSSQINYILLAIVGIFVMTVFVMIQSANAKKQWNKKIKDLDDFMKGSATISNSMDNLARSVVEPLNKIIKNQIKLMKSSGAEDPMEGLKEVKDAKSDEIQVEVSSKRTWKQKLFMQKPKVEDEEYIPQKKNIATAKIIEDEVKQEVEPESESAKLLKTIQEIPDDEPEPKPEPAIKIIDDEPEPIPMTNTVKEIIEAIKMEEDEEDENKLKGEGDFRKFSYEELNQAFKWTQEFNDRHKRRGNERTQEQQIIQECIYYEIIDRWEKRNKDEKIK